MNMAEVMAEMARHDGMTSVPNLEDGPDEEADVFYGDDEEDLGIDGIEDGHEDTDEEDNVELSEQSKVPSLDEEFPSSVSDPIDRVHGGFSLKHPDRQTVGTSF